MDNTKNLENSKEREQKILGISKFEFTGWNSELEVFIITVSNGTYVFEKEKIPEGAEKIYVCWYDDFTNTYSIACKHRIVTRLIGNSWIDELGDGIAEDGITLLTRMIIVSKVKEEINNKSAGQS